MNLPGKAELAALANRQLDDLVLGEIGRARMRLHKLEQRYPSATPRELAERLIDSKKRVGSTAGAISGLFGLVSIPADLLTVTYLQSVLLVELGVLYKANLKSERGRDELLDLLGYANGVGPIVRTGPKLLGRLALTLLERGGLPTLGRAFPVVAAPVTAYLNSRAIERVGEEAIRYFEHR
jgi:uncharacterized protein (DUF697 family)